MGEGEQNDKEHPINARKRQGRRTGSWIREESKAASEAGDELIPDYITGTGTNGSNDKAKTVTPDTKQSPTTHGFLDDV